MNNKESALMPSQHIDAAQRLIAKADQAELIDEHGPQGYMRRPEIKTLTRLAELHLQIAAALRWPM